MWRLQILGGPLDGKYVDNVRPGSMHWEVAAEMKPVLLAGNSAVQPEAYIPSTVYLVVKRSDGRRFLAHPSLHLP
jgi:hypothetical protein